MPAPGCSRLTDRAPVLPPASCEVITMRDATRDVMRGSHFVRFGLEWGTGTEKGPACLETPRFWHLKPIVVSRHSDFGEILAKSW